MVALENIIMIRKRRMERRRSVPARAQNVSMKPHPLPCSNKVVTRRASAQQWAEGSACAAAAAAVASAAGAWRL